MAALTKKIERTMMTMTMEKGFAQVPLERYDELIRMMDEFNNIVKIEADWNGEPALKIDLSKLATRLNEKFEQSEFTGKWIMKDLSDYKETVWGVFKKIDADENQA